MLQNSLKERRFVMSKTYLITLTPTGKFFFGGDMTFLVGANEKDEFNTKFMSYIIRSNKFPQQTSLLGMLRFLILRNNPEMFDAKEQRILSSAKQIINGEDKSSPVEKLIGKTSFYKGKEDGYGKIEKLYPCFIIKDGKPIPYLERDYKYEVRFNESKGHTNKKAVFDLPEIVGYNAKDGIPSLYLINNIEVPESDIFVEDVSNGINRDIVTGKVDENAYFKQVCYRFNDKIYEYEKPEYDNKRERKKDSNDKEISHPCEYKFAFYADLNITDDELATYNKHNLVSLGGDNSQFVINIKTGEPKKSDARGKCVVLESPAYLCSGELEKVCFAITDMIPFKCMKTETKDVKAYNRGLHQYEYTEGLNLYDRGSVFYFKKEDDAIEFVTKLQSHKDFYQIGYNHCKVK